MGFTQKISRISPIQIILTIGIIFSSLHFSCTKRVSEDTQSGIDADSLYIKINVLQDSIQKAWDTMIMDDDEKLGYMRRILLEISYENFQDSKVVELRSMVDSLKSMRYDQKSMHQSKLIDQYDSATSEVSRQIIDFCYEFLNHHESELINELISEINQKNNYVLIYRVHYDVFAEELNNLISEHAQEIEKRGIKVNKMPLFKLPVEEI